MHFNKLKDKTIIQGRQSKRNVDYKHNYFSKPTEKYLRNGFKNRQIYPNFVCPFEKYLLYFKKYLLCKYT